MSLSPPYKQTPLHELASALELRAPQIAYWAGVPKREAELWLAVFRPMSSTSTIALFWCLVSLAYRVRKIQTQGTADMTTTTWGMVQKVGLGPRWFAIIEKKIRTIEEIIPRCKDHLSRSHTKLDFIAAAEDARRRGLIAEATSQAFISALVPPPAAS